MNINFVKNDVPMLLIRLLAGVTMFFAGFEKWIYTSWGGHTAGWSAASSLTNGGGGDLFHPWFVSIAKAGWVEPTVFYGEMLIGLAILLGLTLRIAAISGIVMNGLFWINMYMPLSTVTRAIVDGKIVETRSINSGVFGMGWANGPLEFNAALIAMYFVLIIIGAGGLKYSVAGYLNKLEFVKKNKILRELLIN